MRNHIVAAALTLPLLSFAPDAWAQTPFLASSLDVVPSAPDRFRNFVFAAAGPVVLAETVAWAGVAHASDTPPEWGRGAKGFGKRYASLVVQSVIQEAVTYGLSEATSVDSRFHESRKHGFFRRAGDALLQSSP